jgi:hypothetical protein
MTRRKNMKKMMVLFLIALFPFYLGCFNSDQKQNSNNNDANKIIPPDFTLNIEFPLILQENKSDTVKNKCEGEDPNKNECITMATDLVLWANAVCFWPFVIPITIYKELKNQTPTSSSPEHVEWNYTQTVWNVDYNVSVTAEFVIESQSWEWEFKINDVIWITGLSKEDLTAGSWQYYYEGTTTIRVEWEKTSEINGTVKFINNNQSQEKKYGDYIQYSRVDNLISVRFHDVFSGPNDDGGLLDIEVYWNINGKTGGINNANSSPICTWDLNE